MSGAATAATLLMVVLAMALAFAPRQVALMAGALAIGTALAAGLFASAPAWLAFAGTWASLIVAALQVYWPRLAASRPWLCGLFAINAGAWSGLLAVHEPGSGGAPLFLLGLAAWLPAAWCIVQGWTIALRIVTSWLLAVSLLVGSVPWLIHHPGYVADHRG